MNGHDLPGTAMSSAASSQQVALGGFTSAEAARRLAECGYNELPENGGGDLLDSRLYSQTHS